ncbi:hypothetical protein J3R82DRAFT_3805 [Butyriboletus roseoflavus]|nr:hypothetical protein J3R82DRAFT_3805 [Butyriboletus roseoflavus]
MWLILDRTSLKGIEPTPISLSDVIKCWTASSIDQILFYITFKACNTGFEKEEGAAHGCDGPRSKSFANHMEIYFSSQEISSISRTNSQWSAFWNEQGYIKAYHKLLEE